MNRAAAAIRNARKVVPRATTMFIAQGQEGNPLKVELVTIERNVQQIKENLGLDHTAILFEGRLIDPTTLPVDYVLPARMSHKIMNEAGILALRAYEDRRHDFLKQIVGQNYLFTWTSSV